MATEIENRVVQMTFNNKSFEKNVEKTLSTLDKLKQKLKFDDASEGFEDIQNAAENLDLKRVADNVQTLSDRFSALGIIGMQMWTRIGDAAFDVLTGPFRAVKDELGQIVGSVTNQIKTGGWNRALNLDKAQNMIKNLGYAWDSAGGEMAKAFNADTGKWEDQVNVFTAVDKAVTGTAYSLDEAAVATGNLLPALSKLDNVGDQVTDTLRAVMGASSTYSKDFNQIAGYFQKVATAGVVTQGVISDMQMVGVGASSVLEEYLDLDAEQLQEALDDKLITFEQFRDAFLWKFGDSLDKANDTYEGALANAKSAQSRIGAKVAQPLLEELIPALNLGRIATNEFNKALGTADSGVMGIIIGQIHELGDGLIKTFAVVEKGADGVERVVGLSDTGLSIVNKFSMIMVGVGDAMRGIISIFKLFGSAFYEVFFKNKFENAEDKIKSFDTAMYNFRRMIDQNKDKIKDAFVGFLTVIRSIGTVVIAILKPLIKIVGILVAAAAAIVVFIGKTIKAITESEKFRKIVDKVKSAITNVKTAFKNAIDAIKNFIDQNKILEKIADAVSTVWDAVSGAVEKAWSVLKEAIGGLVDKFKEFYDNAPSFMEVLNGIKDIFEKIWSAIDKGVDRFSEWSGIKLDFPSLEEVEKSFTNLKEDIIYAFQNPQEAIDDLKNKLIELKNFISGEFMTAIDKVQEKFGNFKDWAKNLVKGGDDVQKELADSINDVDGKGIEDKAEKLGLLATAFNNLSTGLDMLWQVAGNIGKKLVDGIAYAFVTLKELFGENLTFDDFMKILKDFMGLWVSFNVGKLAGDIAGFMDTLNNSFKGSSKTIKLLTEQLPGAMLKLAGAMVAISYALGAIGNMKDDDLKKAEAAITGMFSLIALMLILINALNAIKKQTESDDLKIEKEKTKQSKFASLAGKAEAFLKQKIGTAIEFASLGAMITLIGTAILKVGAAIYVLAKAAESANFGDAMAAFVVILGSIIILIYEVAKLFATESKAGEKNLKVFSKMNPKAIAAMGWFLKEFGKAVLIIAAAISALAVIASEFDLMDGIGVFVMISLVLFGLMAAVNAILNKNGEGAAGKFDWAKEFARFAGMAFFMMALSAALLLMIPSIVIFASMDTGELIQGMIAIGALLLIVGAVIAMVGANQPGLSGVGSLIAMIVLLIAAGSLINTIDQVENPENVVGVLILLLAMSLIFAYIATKSGNGYESAATIAAMGAAVFLIAQAIKAIQDVSVGDMFKTIIALAVVLVLIWVFSAAMAGVSKVANGGGMLALAAVILSVGASIFLFAAGLAILIPLIEEIGEKSDQFVEGLRVFGELICAVIVGFIGSLLTTLKAKAAYLTTELAATVLAVIIAIIEFLNDNAFQIGEAFGHLMAALAKAFVAAVVSFVTDIKDTITGKQGFDEHSPSKWFWEVGKFLIYGLIEGIKCIFNKLWDAIGEIVSGIFGFFEHPLDMLKDVGSKIVQGLADGISGAVGLVSSAAEAVMSGLDGLQDTVSSKLFGDPEAEAEKVRQAKAKLEAEEKAAGRSKTADYLYANGGMYALQELQEELKQIDLQRKNIMELRNIKHKDTSSQEADLKWQMGNVEKHYRQFIEEIYKIHDEAGVDWEDLIFNYNGIDYTGAALLRAVGADVAKGFDQGVMAAAKADKTAYKWADMTASQLKEYWGIASPSKLTRKFGRFVAQGFGLGIDDDSDVPLLAFSDMLTNIEDYAEETPISPVVDFTDLQNGAATFGDLSNKFKTEVPAEVDLMNKTNQSRLDNLTDVVNNLLNANREDGLGEKLNAQNDLIATLSSKIDEIGVYLDSGVLAGYLTPKIDKALGFRAGNVGRSVHA